MPHDGGMPNFKIVISQKARGLTATRAFLFTALSVQLIACAPQAQTEATSLLTPLASQITKTLGCSNQFESAFYDGLYEIALGNKEFASTESFRSVIDSSLHKGRLEGVSARDQEDLVISLTNLYQTLTGETLSQARTQDEIVEILTSMEVGDESTPERAALHQMIQSRFADVNAIASRSPSLPACTESISTLETSEAIPGTLIHQLMTARHPVVAGGLKAMAVGYQSCEAPFRAALGPNTPDVRGVTITGPYPPPSPGNKREITNLSALISSHPYLSDYRRPSSSCFNVLARPLIYDFGGKPNTTSSKGAALDFFTNQGGTGVLGIDCSGYVFSAIATSGLRIAKGKPLKPIQVHSTNAAKFMRPKASGLTCFNPVSFSGLSTIKPGDILASGGHIMIIDTVGDDPFGIAEISKESDCTLGRMSSSRFKMTFLQSGSAKGGLGLSRMKPEKFLPEDEEPMDKAMKEYAVAACKARIRGSVVSAQPSSAAIVRHSGTSDCLGPKVKLAREECIASCPSL